MASLVLAAGFTFGGHLSDWAISDLKEQFSKLAPWNMHWPTVHFLQQCFVLVLSNKYEQKRRKETHLILGHLWSDILC